jgi:glycosyltransferase involved in cell wall biosynthesis
LSRTILYLTPYPPVRSGIADYARAYKSALEARTDWRLSVVTCRPRAAGNGPPGLWAPYRRVRTWQSEGRLEDVAFVHAEIGVKQHDEFWTLFWLRRLLPDAPYCVTVHDPPLVVAPALYPLAFGLRTTAVRRALRVLDHTPVGRTVVRAVLEKAGAVFALSEAGRESLRSLVPDPARRKKLPFLGYGGSGRGRPEKGVPRSPRVLFLGFWGPGRGLDILLTAAESALRRRPGCLRLVLAGGVEEGGANRRYVERIRARIRRSPAREAIEDLGYVPAEQLDGAFTSADVFVLPSTLTRWLSTSSVLFRAMGAGLAVVASDVAGVGEEIRHRETGILVPPGDAEALAEALLVLVGEPALRMRLGREARAHVEAEHSEARVADAAASTYEALARP